LIIAVFAGVLSCFPNVGMNYAGELKAAAVQHGASETMAGNAAWALLFTAGFAVNFLYCVGLMLRRGNARLFAADFPRNVALIGSMALLWIGSFYLYGMGAARLGRWGGIIGWPLFISLAILVGNLWGLGRGEWAAAPETARRQLKLGLGVLLGAMVLFGIASALKT
jgi:L-rhamnose-H+ transport protein